MGDGVGGEGGRAGMRGRRDMGGRKRGGWERRGKAYCDRAWSDILSYQCKVYTSKMRFDFSFICSCRK